MSIYEARLRGIATDVNSSRADLVSSQVRLFVTEAVSRGLINFSRGTITNPTTGQDISIGEAIKIGLLITDFNVKHEDVLIDFDLDSPTISLCNAFQHCFDSQSRLFHRRTTSENLTLEQSVQQEWINSQDIIFDVTSNYQCTLKQALNEGLIDGKNCDYKIKSEQNQKSMFILDAAKAGLVAVFPEIPQDLEPSDITFSLREAVDNGTFNAETNKFGSLTILKALRSGLVDYRSAEVTNTASSKSYNLLEAVEQKIINENTAYVRDVKKKTDVSLLEAYEQGLLRDVELDSFDTFEMLSLWEAIERQQLDTETGLFYSLHEEKKTMSLEEALYRKYIDKKSAFVKDTWKRKYCSLSEASRKKIIKDGKIMNTTTGKYLSLRKAIDLQIVVKEIRFVSLIELLDFGMYLPHSGKISIPGLEREMSLGEAVDLKIIDHTRTIVKSRKTNRFISLYEAIKVEGVVDGLTGLYAGSMNLLEARSKGYLLSIDAMVNSKTCRNETHTKLITAGGEKVLT